MNKKKVIKIVIMIVIIIVIIILLLHTCSHKNKVKEEKPIDIIEPKPDDKKTDDTKNEIPIMVEDNRTEIEKRHEQITVNTPNVSEGEPLEEEEAVFVYEEGAKNWGTSNELKIFSSFKEDYIIPGKIAPGMSDEYDFTVKNTNKFSTIINVNFEEENDYNLDILYRLKLDDNYVIGDDNTWVQCDDLIIEDKELSSKENLKYKLEWKWFEGPIDNQIGSEAVATYKIKISILAEEKI